MIQEQFLKLTVFWMVLCNTESLRLLKFYGTEFYPLYWRIHLENVHKCVVYFQIGNTPQCMVSINAHKGFFLKVAMYHLTNCV